MATSTPILNLWLGDHGDWPNAWDSPMRENWNIMDALFHASTGHAHTGASGDGPKIDHDDLIDGGSTSHADIDADLFKSKVTSADTSPDYLMGATTPKIVAGPSGNVTVTKLNPGADEQVEIEVPSVTPTLGDVNDPSGEYGWKHFTPTSAPVAYTDNFCYPLGFPLTQGDYLTNMTTAAQDFLCSQVAAQSFVDTHIGEPLTGQYASVVCCQIPHGVAQRTTLSISDFDYAALQPGDGVCFTISVFSTHVLGSILPQLYGVFLEIHFTVLPGPLYQVTHRVVILPGDGSRIDLPSCVHTDPDDIEGCWELSLDANGHVYTYWRRAMVYSSQSSPPNSTGGPVTPAIIALMKAAALAQGDPVYGSMGFGWQYTVLAGSQYSTEIRWLSVCSDNDLYHEEWECVGEPPLGVPDEISLPKVIFTDGGPYIGNPGTICCTGPTVAVGEVIGTDPGGTDIVVTARGNTFSPGSDREFGPGYATNVSPGPFTPCAAPTGTPVIHQLSGNFAENDGGTLLITGVEPYCPNLHVESLTAGFNIESFAWVDYDELMITYTADDCTGGTAVTVRVSNVVKANTVDIALGSLTSATPVITSVDTEDTFYGDDLSSEVMEGVETLVTLHGTGFDPDVDITSGQGFVTISDVTFVDCETVTFKVLHNFDNGAPDTQITATNAGTGLTTGVHTISTTPMPPHIYNIDATTNVAMSSNVIVTLYTVFTDQTSPATVTSLSGAEFVINNVVVNPGTIVLDVNLGPTVSTDCQVEVSNPLNGTTTIVDVIQIGHAVPIVGVFSPVSAVEGHKKLDWSFDGVGITPSTQFVPTGGLSSHGWYSIAGDLVVVTRTVPVRLEGTMSVACGDVGAMNFSVQNPGDASGPFSLIGVLTTAASVVPGVTLTTPDSADPGAVGVGVVIDANDVFIPSTILGSQYLSVSNIIATPGGPGQVGFDVDVSADAPEGSTQQMTAVNPCGNTELFNFDIEYVAPIITSWICSHPEENRPNEDTIIKGTGMRVGGVLTVLAPHSLVGFTRIDDETVEAEISFGVAGPITITWTNSDTKDDSIVDAIVAEPAPSNIHVDVDEGAGAEFGSVGQKLRIYGWNLWPAKIGVLKNFVNASLTSVDIVTDSYIEATIDVTGSVAAVITCDIEGDAADYPVTVGPILPAPTGATVITSFAPDGPPEFYENTLVQPFVAQGENLDDVATMDVVFTDINRSRDTYEPFGATPAGTIIIVSKNSNEIKGTISIAPSVAQWQIDIQLYDISPALLDTLSGVDVAIFAGPPPSPTLTDIPLADTQYGVPVAGAPIVFDLYTDFDASDVVTLEGLGVFNAAPVWAGDHWVIDLTHGPVTEIDAVVITRVAGPPGTERHYSNGANV